MRAPTSIDSHMRAATSKRFSFLRVAWRHVTSERESSAGAALALLLALLPAGLVLVNGSAARVDLRGVIAATGPITVQHAGIADGQPFDEFQRQAQGTVARQLGRYVDRGSAVAIAAPFRLTSIGPHEPTAADARGDVAVTYVDDLPRRVDVVQGLLPRPGGREPRRPSRGAPAWSASGG